MIKPRREAFPDLAKRATNTGIVALESTVEEKKMLEPKPGVAFTLPEKITTVMPVGSPAVRIAASAHSCGMSSSPRVIAATASGIATSFPRRPRGSKMVRRGPIGAQVDTYEKKSKWDRYCSRHVERFGRKLWHLKAAGVEGNSGSSCQG